MKRLFYFLLLATLIISCEPKGDKPIIVNGEEKNLPAQFDFGKAKDGIYSNSFFKLRMNYDTSWVIQNEAQLQQLSELGEDLVLGDNSELRQLVEASKVNTASLFTIFRYEPMATANSNPSLVLMAENTKMVPTIKTGKDYLESAKKHMANASLDFKVEDGFAYKKIGSENFYVMKTILSFGPVDVHQEYISTVKKGFSLSFILSYTNNEEKEMLYEIIDSVKM